MLNYSLTFAHSKHGYPTHTIINRIPTNPTNPSNARLQRDERVASLFLALDEVSVTVTTGPVSSGLTTEVPKN